VEKPETVPIEAYPPQRRWNQTESPCSPYVYDTRMKFLRTTGRILEAVLASQQNHFVDFFMFAGTVY
jgi:hypothetical protein